MSEVKVDTISERTADGGVTIDGVLVKDGVATFQTAAGSPLVFEGATADDYETTFAITDPTADRTITFPDSSFTVPTSGGLTQASTWRLNSSFTGTGDLTTNLEAVDAPVGFGSKGSAMGETSGIFDFPVTGIWLVKGHFYYWQNGNGSSYYGTGHLYTTTNNSSYAEAAQCRTSDYYSAYGSMTVEYIFDVTDIANCKCKFSVTQGNSSAQTIGHTDINKTYFTFLRLADT